MVQRHSTMDHFSVSWLVALVIGGAGGGLNAVLSDHGRLLPSLVTLSPGHTQVVRIGIIGNVFFGAVAAACLILALQVAGSTLTANGDLGLLLLACSDFFVAFVSSRWVTNEVDKQVLRKAICKAVSAPAADPDTIADMEVAAPYAIYAIVDRLLPRRAGHR
jgi:hypothetical protein